MLLSKFHETCKKLDAANDQNLKKYFTKTSAVAELTRFDSPRVLAVGLKGVGKSATFRYLTEFERRANVIVGITPTTHTLLLPNRNLHFATCRKQFEHDLVLEALRAVVDQRESLSNGVDRRLLDEAARQVKSYTKILSDFAGKIGGGGVSILGCGFTITKRDQLAVGLRQEKDIQQAIDALAALSQAGVKIRIIVDDPEHVFSASRDLDTHLVGGFALAALHLSRTIPGLRVVALLKSHVYYPVLGDVEDLQKYPDHMARLSWTEEELVEFVNNRLKWSGLTLTDLVEGSNDEALALLARMCASVRNGPRDLLRWIDVALQISGVKKLTSKVIQQSRRDMSVYSLEGLGAAHSNEYPKISAIIRVIFRDNASTKYAPDELRRHIQDLLVKDEMMGALSRVTWMQSQNSDTLPVVLFETGAIALERDGREILPYHPDYHFEHFVTASRLYLCPALTDAIRY